ncbi:MAG: patatin-like phospholipase family protein [Rhizobacter sp.]|nr:patatin-like phospholipase family protein [Ferruginibacter sp.]
MKTGNTEATANINEFLTETNVESVISEIETSFQNNGRPIYSDIYKEEADGKIYEYVNYVQEGGGVLGVALVGYTYVLERLGFRFLKLAGTSAGAINTLLMASVDPKNYKADAGREQYKYQSEIILDEMLRFDLWKLVDGHWFAKWLIKIFIGKKNTYNTLIDFISFSLAGVMIYATTLGMLRLYQFNFMQRFVQSDVHDILVGIGCCCTVVLLIQWWVEVQKNKKLVAQQLKQDKVDAPKEIKEKSWYSKALWLFIFFFSVPFVLHLVFHFVVTIGLIGHAPEAVMNIIRIIFHAAGALSVVGLIFTVVAFLYFKGRFSRAGYGINPGDTFQLWMMDIMKRNNTQTYSELEAVMENRINNAGLQVRPDARDPDRNAKFEKPFMSIMASDITLQTKAEFPLNAGDYWKDPLAVNPAEFVRASMSIPVFFSPHKVKVEQAVQDESELWHQKSTAEDKTNTLKKEIWFVDGGVLSNFPINIFHNPQILIARVPTFGVKLEDEAHVKPENEYKPANTKFLGFLGDIFSTIRYYYDKDFLKRNTIYDKAIAHIDVEKINWLDFGMTRKTKIELFNRGAEAAKAFFMGGVYWVDGKMYDSKKVAPGDAIGEAFKNGFNWEKFKEFRKQAIEAGRK